MNKDLKNFLLLVLLSACWGPSFLFMKVAVEHIPPITLTASRLLIGGVLLFIILKFKKVSLPKFDKKYLHLLFVGLIQSAIPFTLFAASEQYVDSSIAAIISGSSPLFTLILAHIFFHDDKITKNKLIGSIIGFFGLFVLIFGKSGSDQVTINLLGALMSLLAAICYAIGFVYAKKHIHGLKPMVAPTVQLIFGFLFLLPFSFLFETHTHFSEISTPAILSVVGLGVLGSAIAFTLYYKLLDQTNSTYVSMVNYLTPLFGIVLGIFVLSEKLFWNSYLGCVMILLGVMINGGIIKISFAHRFWKRKNNELV